jgi:predicted ATPase
MAGLILHYLGEQTEAGRRIEWSLGNAVTRPKPLPATRFVLDQGVAANALLARILWLQRFPDRARHAAENAVRQADDHVLSHCHALAQAACPLALWTGDLAAADQCTRMLIDLATHNVLEGWVARGKCFQGALLIHRGSFADGVAQLRGALQELRAAGSSAEYPYFLATLAHGLMSAGQIRQAHAAVDAAIDRSEATGERWCAAELLRIKAEILLRPDASDTTAAEQHFRRSLDVARSQGAASWELRTAIDLATLLTSRGQSESARATLAPVYAQFTEGLDTADVMTAQRLLSTLRR